MGSGRLASFARKRIKKSRMVVPRGKRKPRTASLTPRREIIIRSGRAKIKKIFPHRPRVFQRFAHPRRYFFAFNNFDKKFASLIRSWARAQTEWSPVKKKTNYNKNWTHPSLRRRTLPSRGFTQNEWSKGIAPTHMVRRINEERRKREDRLQRGRPRKKDRRGGARENHAWKGKNSFDFTFSYLIARIRKNASPPHTIPITNIIVIIVLVSIIQPALD